ncbi:glucosamine 6-phosphate synthetase [bacterium]|nr:glucosamine 6-phosphate synthetase [bacterium]
MCGIFGIISPHRVDCRQLSMLVLHSQQRGKDSSGLIWFDTDHYEVERADFRITRLLESSRAAKSNIVMGHSRLITNGLSDNQPVVRDGVCVLHNGIVVNHEDVWNGLTKKRELEIDTEVLAAVAAEHLEQGRSLEELPTRISELCKGIVACAIAIPKLGKLCLFSNNGSLYVGSKDESIIFASESYMLNELQCNGTEQLLNKIKILDIPASLKPTLVVDRSSRTKNLIPALRFFSAEESLLENARPVLRRCTKCILPETMPFISFDANGVCNYCQHYKPRNKPRPKEELLKLVEPYRRREGNECILPFSGGRDSCYALHLVVKELKMKPVTYTYDWGMVTDLGRRNISRMCSELGVENIIVADDIAKKRDFIARNLRAWLKSPHLGMVSILTAGDKHFFRHIETVKKQTGLALNLWGVNPLEVTHFKAGFLGVPPDFEEKRVYSHGAMKQLRYQFLRFKAMLQSPGYFNLSLWDTLSGEYYRSFTEKADYYHIFDYWQWDEKLIDSTLSEYEWERAPDTNTTWRIGDGTAAFYNYVYGTVAGFTEHDTFRSNQIREGDISREEALVLVADENRPRYPNIKWYLDSLGLNFSEVVSIINSIPRLYAPSIAKW